MHREKEPENMYGYESCNRLFEENSALADREKNERKIKERQRFAKF